MQSYVQRQKEQELRRSLAANPVTAILGPRQCGKSTLARHCLAACRNILFLDLDLPSDARKLDEPELFLREHGDRLVCIDEIQLRPGIFPLLRALVDQDRRPGRYVLLGSASRDLIRQSTETLAGRIHYLELTPFLLREIAAESRFGLRAYKRLWIRGGFPPAFLERSSPQSMAWRLDLIQTFLTRDLPQFGFHLPAVAMHRFWKMLAHYHGQVFNASKLGQALDLSHVSVRRYLDILENTFMVRVLRPLELNLKKRLVKSPKVYIRDSGILHGLLEIDAWTDLFGHPVFGVSWEGWCIEQIANALPDWRAGYYRASSGEEIDLILERGKTRLAFEFKASASPKLTKGFQGTLAVIKPECTWVVCPTDQAGYSIKKNVRVAGIGEVVNALSPFAQKRP